MIIDKDINPERQVYYMASLILRELNDSKNIKVDFF